MSLFDETEIVARHQSLATSVSDEVESLRASTELIRKAVLSLDTSKMPLSIQQDAKAAALLTLRVVNNAGACTKLTDSGYFAQAASHVRDTAETAMLALLFSEEPTHISKWTVAGENRHRLYGRRSLKKLIRQKQKFGYLDEFFDTFSQYGGHPSPETVTAHHDGHGFQIGPHFNRRLFTATYRDVAVSTWWATDACADMWTAMGAEPLDRKFADALAKFQSSADGIFPS